MLAFLFCLLPFVPTAAADNCTGVWTGQLTLDGKGHEIQFVLKHQEELSGNLQIEEDSAGLRSTSSPASMAFSRVTRSVTRRRASA